MFKLNETITINSPKSKYNGELGIVFDIIHFKDDTMYEIIQINKDGRKEFLGLYPEYKVSKVQNDFI